MNPDGRIIAALVFALIGVGLGNFATELYTVAFGIVEVSPLLPSDELERPSADAPEIAMGLLISITIAPMLFLVMIAMMVTVCHVCLFVLGGARHGIHSSLRVAAYVFGATALLWIFPIYGVFVGAIWGELILILGLARVHETTLTKSLLAVFGAQLTCFGSVIGLLAVGSSL